MSRNLSDLEETTEAMALQLLGEAEAAGISLLVVHTFRSLEEQAFLYAKGRSIPGPIVTYGKPGFSWHNYRRALDVVPIDSKGKPMWTAPRPVWNQLGAIGERIGFAWGGRFKKFPDLGHFENSRGLRLVDFRVGRVS